MIWLAQGLRPNKWRLLVAHRSSCRLRHAPIAVNADFDFPRSAEVKFPSLAGWRSAEFVIGASIFWRSSRTPERRRGRRGLDAGFCPNMFGQQIGVFAQAIARAFDLEDDRVVQKPIEQRCGDDGIAKDFAPLGSASLYAHMAGSKGSIGARGSSMPARPYMARFSVLRRLICPSAWPLLQCSTMAFPTASISWLNVRANCCIERTKECFAS